MKTKSYKEWSACNPFWKVKYDEEDCQYIFINEQKSIDQLFSCMKYQAKLKMGKLRCNNLDISILNNFRGNITWETQYR